MSTRTDFRSSTGSWAGGPVDSSHAAATESSSSVAGLLITRGPDLGTRFAITAPTMRIGRHHDCEIRLDDVSISVRHAEIRTRDSGGHVLLDSGSLTGTYVNREPIRCVDLVTGDEIRIGKVWFRYADAASARSAREAQDSMPERMIPRSRRT